MQKVDLVMWIKHAPIEAVLQRLNQVIPASSVNQKLMVIDSFSELTCDRKRVEGLGWQFITNKGCGISGAANTGLDRIQTERFCSFEQDLLLARDWWLKIPPLLDEPRMAAACGLRFATQPLGLRNLQLYVASKYRGASGLPSWLRSREASSFTLGKTLDNTIYKTEAMHKIGGFPKLKTNAGVDTVLAYRLRNAGYEWKVNSAVKSEHLRSSLSHELQHQEWYGKQIAAINRALKHDCQVNPSISPLGAAFRFMVSPFTGVFMALQTGDATVAYIHPLVKLHYTKGLLEGSHG